VFIDNNNTAAAAAADDDDDNDNVDDRYDHLLFQSLPFYIR